MPSARTRVYLTAAAAAAVLATGAAVGLAHDRDPEPVAGQWVTPSSAAAPAPARPSTSATPLPAAEPPDDLPVISYEQGPRGLPADPEQNSTVAPTQGLRPSKRVALYDAPGGEPRAFLPPKISGLRTVVPIVGEDNGWVAVLVPSVNRRIGWVPPGDWEIQALRDQLVLQRSGHTLSWLRDGQEQQRWTVAVGSAATPTPVGRTYVMGTTRISGEPYLGLDALVLGSIPDDREKMAAAFQLAHTGIHAWYRSSVFGRSVSNGCIRMPGAAQRTLLDEIGAGTPLTVLA